MSKITDAPLTVSRIGEIDSLRGLAALSVLLFHYTTRYEQLYGHQGSLPFSAPLGHYGVNLFFMVSGFVIFMTLDRVRRPRDFVVSRFSRLFPAYWTAVLLTFVLSHVFSLPGKTVEIPIAAANLLMFHGLFGIPHVDNVYWTLEIELIFYAWSLFLFMTGRLHRIHGFLAALLILKCVYFSAAKLFHIDLPYRIGHLLILDYIAWFTLGIMIFRLSRSVGRPLRRDYAMIVLSLLVIALTLGMPVALLALVLCVLLFGAAKGYLPMLAHPALVWLGTISYCLYLLHENIGWGLIRVMEQSGISPAAAIAAATISTVALAATVTFLIERPALAGIRAWYRRRSAVGTAASGAVDAR